MFNKKLIESLKSVINDLEDENKMLKHNNLILLENSIELRRKIKSYEFLLEAEAEKLHNKNNVKRGRKPKKEAE